MTKFRIKRIAPYSFVVQRQQRFLFWPYWQTETDGGPYESDIHFGSTDAAQAHINARREFEEDPNKITASA